MSRRVALCVAALLAWPAIGLAQTPDRRGEVSVGVPEWRGIKASAPIPPELHVHNEGGRDGAGLCVICSVLANGRYQGVPGLGSFDPCPIGEGGKDSRLWKLAKSRPGGYSPEKLKRLVAEALPGEPYASLVGSGTDQDFQMIERMSKAGYPIGMTMNTAALYRYMPIHHMVSWLHFRLKGWCCYTDNNNPGVYSWIPSAEAMRRAVDMGSLWAWVWTRRPSRPDSALPAVILIGIGAAALRPNPVADSEEMDECSDLS